MDDIIKLIGALRAKYSEARAVHLGQAGRAEGALEFADVLLNNIKQRAAMAESPLSTEDEEEAAAEATPG